MSTPARAEIISPVRLYRELAKAADWVLDKAVDLERMDLRIMFGELDRMPTCEAEYSWEGYPEETLARCRDLLRQFDLDEYYDASEKAAAS